MKYPWVLPLILLASSTGALADEGMWQPELLPDISERLTARGLRLDPETLTDLTAFPMGAIVGLGFCTASFVSPSGLLVTNHHCAYGAIQYASTEDDNLLRNGFVAPSFSDERRGNPALSVYVTESIESVTAPIDAVLSDSMTGAQRFAAIEGAQKDLVAECEQDEGYRCDVYTFYGGAEYRLIKQLELRDVRLVYAPPESLGKYGGDVDNWIWPRHTGDFSFLRAYVGPDGEPADYHADNVPYEPKHHLKVNARGLKEGDFAMAVGYPASTSRYALALEVEYAVAVNYPNRIESIERMLAAIKQSTRGRPDAALKYAGTVASSNNGLKNYQGMLDGFAATDVPAEKRRLEQTISKNPSAARAVKSLRDALAADIELRESERLYDAVRRRGLLGSARRLYRLSLEREKDDADRKPGYQERDWPRIEASIEQMERRVDAQVDAALLLVHLQEYASLPKARRRAALDEFVGLDGELPDVRKLKLTLDGFYEKTQMSDAATRKNWLTADPADFRESQDPFIRLAVALFETDLALEQSQESREGELERYRAEYMSGILSTQDRLNQPAYDDANNSLRVTYGSVVGYSPQDGIVKLPFTTLQGILEKDTGRPPFDAPAVQIQAIGKQQGWQYASEDLDAVPVNFLTSLDVTGGNSGSPTLDRNGKLVGLVFDGNYESINADWWFNDRLTRTIHVDIRYMLWVMDVVSNAKELLRELGVRQ